MPSQKKSPLPKDSTIELESNPWLTAYKKVSGELEEGEITIRGFIKLMLDSGNTPITPDAAKGILGRMCKEGLAVCVGKKVVRQDGFRPSTVSVYRLTNANDKS